MNRKSRTITSWGLSLLLLVASFPTFALAEVALSESQSAQGMQALYRLHAIDAAPWEEDGGWTVYNSKEHAEEAVIALENNGNDQNGSEQVTLNDDGSLSVEEDSNQALEGLSNELESPAEDTNRKPLDMLSVKLSNDEAGIEYRVRKNASADDEPAEASATESSEDAVEADVSAEATNDANSSEEEWADEWAQDGEPSVSEQGITGVQMRLTDELDQEYDVWYRGMTEDGTWLEWKSDGESLADTDNEPLYDLQVVITTAASKDEAASQEAATNEEPTAKTDTQEQTSQANTTTKAIEPIVEAEAAAPSISYIAHVQRKGWLDWVRDGATAGTTGEALRVEGLYFSLDGAQGDVMCAAHVQGIGWQDEVGSGNLVGTEGQSKRIEAVKLRLTGEIANSYDIWYRAHVQGIGWQTWVCNGAMCGTEGQSKRMEAIEVLLVQKGNTIPTTAGSDYEDSSSSTTADIRYQAHVQTYGWQAEVSNGETAGTSGEAKRVEAFRIKLAGIDGGIRYKAHVQRYGWMDWMYDGAIAGTTGESLRVEAVQIELTGNAKQEYSVYYRTHVQHIGWTAWSKDGEENGSTGCSYRMEALQIMLVANGEEPPISVDSDTPTSAVTKVQLNGVDISGWDEGINIAGTEGDFFIIKATEGVQGTIYNPWYRQWANEVLDSGRLVGFYHYANGGDPLEEADSFVEAIQGFKGRAIACLDWEGIGNDKFDTGADVEWCKKFLDRVKLRFGGTPYLYTSKNYTNIYDWSSVAEDYPLWGAEYPDYKDINGYQDDPWQSSNPWGAWGSQPTIFQYTSTGVLKNNGGIDHFDFDLFYGGANDWLRYQL